MRALEVERDDQEWSLKMINWGQVCESGDVSVVSFAFPPRVDFVERYGQKGKQEERRRKSKQ